MQDRAVAIEGADPGQQHRVAEGRVEPGQEVLRRVGQFSGEGQNGDVRGPVRVGTGQLPSTEGDGTAEGLALRPTGVERHPLHLWPQGIFLEEEEEKEKEMKEGEEEEGGRGVCSEEAPALPVIPTFSMAA